MALVSHCSGCLRRTSNPALALERQVPPFSQVLYRLAQAARDHAHRRPPGHPLPRQLGPHARLRARFALRTPRDAHAQGPCRGSSHDRRFRARAESHRIRVLWSPRSFWWQAAVAACIIIMSDGPHGKPPASAPQLAASSHGPGAGGGTRR
jgi:hypothetical protein